MVAGWRASACALATGSGVTRWYRAYEGTVTDPKLGEAALLAECSRAVAIATWHALLESAATVNDAGRYDTTARRVAVILCEPPALITSVLDAFSELGLISAGAVTAWKRRQYESDNSTERARKSRANKKAPSRNGDATLQERCAAPPEAETDTDIPEADASGPAAPPAPPIAMDFCKAVFDSGRAILTKSGKTAREAGSLIGRWRQSLGDPEILTLIRQAEAEAISDPAAWLSAAVETRNGNRPQRRMDAQPDLRGARPDPSLDLLRAARRAEEEERAGSSGADRGRTRPALPAIAAS
jgi:hypothetical protein